jgi:hypothetical protein
LRHVAPRVLALVDEQIMPSLLSKLFFFWMKKVLGLSHTWPRPPVITISRIVYKRIFSINILPPHQSI